MILFSVFRHLLSDEESLGNYSSGKLVTFADIERRMFLKERSENRQIPDHHYRLLTQKTFQGLENISDVLTDGLYQLVKTKLYFRGKKIFVRQSAQGDWQDLITYIPPLILQSVFIHINEPLSKYMGDKKDYFMRVILPNFRNTALPHPHIKSLADSIKSKMGFHDLHIHLNGSTETDKAWQDYLFAPDKVFKDFNAAYSDRKVKEQLEQESPLFEPARFRNLLSVARKIRTIMFLQIHYPQSLDFGQMSREQLLNFVIHSEASSIYEDYCHPFASLIGEEDNFRNHMAVEALMYVIVLDYLSKNKESFLSELFHFYLLILGLCNRLLVQQTHQYGFEQFQKLTLNRLREFSEQKKYLDRFLQIQGNELQNLNFLEGRFSPPKTAAETVAILDAIINGWHEMQKEVKLLRELSVPEIRLVAHFIKKEDSTPPDQLIRHKLLRYDIFNRAEILSLIIKNNNRYRDLITGVDAASSEFDAPPETFAPVFRMLRRNGLQHFTYHAGEDFFHIFSGLRAIYEAVFFTEMQPGDRIGHAVAAGLSPKLWLKAVGEKILIRKGEWLDNLIFIHYLINSSDLRKLQHHLKNIESIIRRLSSEIYKEKYSLRDMEVAWCYRRFEPAMVQANDRKEAESRPIYNYEEWAQVTMEVKNLKARNLFLKYHDISFRGEYDQIIEISNNDLLRAEDIVDLQKELLKILTDRKIIIETLPTSNIRIGHHKNLKSYHLWTWMEWKDRGELVPDIVLGTDDTGIFATNILNEYSNLYCHLTQVRKESSAKAFDALKLIDDNGQSYKFLYR